MLWRSDDLPIGTHASATFLPFGNGRSYGDVCLNNGGVLVDCRGLNRFISFCPDTGILRCEAGILLSEILAFSVPRGWFLPVTPGTQFVTLGGAIANDVHGKNHHRHGTFGRHVLRFELLRSDGARVPCAPYENRDWFEATVGGLGLTGVITWAEIRLRRIHTPLIDQETIRYRNLDGFFSLSDESDESFEYTVAWVDCLARGSSVGRGLFLRGNHAEKSDGRKRSASSRSISVPFTPPVSLVNGLSLRILNSLYYRKSLSRLTSRKVSFTPFFYPLDAVRRWNRLYGPGGLLQYQCLLPNADAQDSVKEILERIARAGTGSFLAVLKRFGHLASPGLLSFPAPGITLALDFPNRGRRTLELLDTLDEVTLAAGGRVNPSKDARMAGESFRRFFPRWQELNSFKDPAFSSSFWRRVTADWP